MTTFFASEMINGLPVTWLVIEKRATGEEKLVGSMTMNFNELGASQAASRNPWVSYFYIEPEYRNARIGYSLCDYVCDAISLVGYPQFYVFSTNATPLYIEEELFKGELHTILVMPYRKSPNQAISL